MAANGTAQLLRSSFFQSEFPDRILIQDKFMWRERVHLQPSPTHSTRSKLASTSNGVTALAAAVCYRGETFQAWKENGGAKEMIPGETGAPVTDHGLLVAEENSSLVSEQEYPVLDDPLTALQRFLLETQWALTADQLSEQHLNLLDRKPQREGVPEVVSSGRPPARQRRIQAKRTVPDLCQKSASSSLKMATTPIHSTARMLKTGKKGRLPKARGSYEYSNTYTSMRTRNKRALLTAEQEIDLSKVMRVGLNLRFVKTKLAERLGCEPTDDQWALSLKMPLGDLNAKLRDADKARDEMFLSNVRLVVSVAKRYAKHGVDMSDLIQEGALGLLRGLEKFNHKKGFKLSTYVHWWIRQGVTRAIAENSRMVRVPVYVHERLSLIRKAKAILKVEGATISVKNISEILNMSDKKVSNALMVTKKTTSLDKMRGSILDEDENLHSYIADPVLENNPWVVVDKLHMKEDINGLLASTLAPREQEIIRSHYGLDRADGRCLSLENISKRIGLSRERIRQLENIALRKLNVSSQAMNLDVSRLTQ